MTLEEILSVLEEDDLVLNITEQDDDSNEDNTIDDNASTDAGETQHSENEDVDVEAEKNKLVDNLNRLIILKDTMEELNNYKQSDEIASILNKIRVLLISISDRIKKNEYEEKLSSMNAEMEKLIKMIIVFLKQVLNPNFGKPESIENEVQI